MSAIAPALLDAATLARRLVDLAREERSVQVEFLLHLSEFDRREAWLEAGYGSLWDWCLKVLHLREGAAWRRIRAMRVLRRLPGLAEALRDGRLCLTTVGLLDPVLTEENAEALVARAAFKTKAEVEVLVVSLRPCPAPKDGLRRLPERQAAAIVLPSPSPSPSPTPAPAPAPTSAPTPTRPTVRPVAADTWSLRVTVDADLKRDLDQLTELLSHMVPNGDLTAVLREAVRCAIEKHGTRKGAVAPARRRARAAMDDPSPATQRKPVRAPISAEVRREIWQRDEGRCAWVGPDGHRCGSRWQVEVDHVEAAARGGPPTVENLRLACRAHNRLHAEETFGRAFMARFRRNASPSGESASPGESSLSAPAWPAYSPPPGHH